ncbi:MAG: DUF192 domain-containing protein [Phycisphaerales bacterium]|nr:DUF192 domain-containing protein [Phycisphaerales bacterium]
MAAPSILIATLARLLAACALALAAAGCATTLTGCERKAPPGTVRVEISGRPFFLKLAADDTTRVKGLGGVASIEPDGGMIFVFPVSIPLEFIMRDCPSDIDVAFLNERGMVVSLHEMKAEEPRRPDEPETGNFATDKYEARLKRYPSVYPARFAVEVAPGTLRRLGVRPGDVFDFDRDAVKAAAR